MGDHSVSGLTPNNDARPMRSEMHYPAFTGLTGAVCNGCPVLLGVVHQRAPHLDGSGSHGRNARGLDNQALKALMSSHFTTSQLGTGAPVLPTRGLRPNSREPIQHCGLHVAWTNPGSTIRISGIGNWSGSPLILKQELTAVAYYLEIMFG